MWVNHVKEYMDQVDGQYVTRVFQGPLFALIMLFTGLGYRQTSSGLGERMLQHENRAAAGMRRMLTMAVRGRAPCGLDGLHKHMIL